MPWLLNSESTSEAVLFRIALHRTTRHCSSLSTSPHSQRFAAAFERRASSRCRLGSIPRIIEAAATAQRESNEALEARAERFQQLRFSVQAEHARARLVLPASDIAERLAEVVAIFDGALEDGLEQAALEPDGALEDATPVLVTTPPGHLGAPEVQITDDVGLRDLVEPRRAEVGGARRSASRFLASSAACTSEGTRPTVPRSSGSCSSSCEFCVLRGRGRPVLQFTGCG